ncbi:ammonium transporter Rh type B-B-like [Tubulanus polymorphus]|uniref:ammonium transporter Rh type B-B-like n=1 Tax=Tubulanus polymorphus TaxID=672921 RepID=UPI003DA5A0A3
MAWRRGKLSLILIAIEILFIVLFAIFVDYDKEANAKDPSNNNDTGTPTEKVQYYPMFQDVHVMIFVGFGFLMTFLKKYGFSSMGYNFLISAICIQWFMLIHGFFHLHDGKILIGQTSLITADFSAAAVLISFGAVLGKTSPLQLVIMCMLEIPIFAVNEWVAVNYLMPVDIGGSMIVHTFGAYFGLAVARVLYTDDIVSSRKEGSVYHSDLFAMIGSIFLWMFWPSFNAALATGDERTRAIINTYISLAACCVVTFAVSNASNKEKFDMVHIQNATLAGGVAIGTSADLMITPFGALIVGSGAAVLSVLGYRFLTPCMTKKIKVHDTCGVNNLHGMPGILAGIVGIIVTSQATETQYGKSLYQIFPAMAPVKNSTELAELQKTLSVDPGLGRTAAQQALFQLATLGMTLGMALVGGAITGFILKISIWDAPKSHDLFDDDNYWEVPEEEALPYIVEDKDESAQTVIENLYAKKSNLADSNNLDQSVGIVNMAMADTSTTSFTS